jgi:hypothetical protein
VESDAAVAAFVVVVQEEGLAERAGVFDAAEALGKASAYFRAWNAVSM